MVAAAAVMAACSGAQPPPLRDPAHEAMFATIAPATHACAVERHYDGYLPISVTVNDQGLVARAAVPAFIDGVVDGVLVDCVTRAVGALRFPASPRGAVFTYPLILSSR